MSDVLLYDILPFLSLWLLTLGIAILLELSDRKRKRAIMLQHIHLISIDRPDGTVEAYLKEAPAVHLLARSDVVLCGSLAALLFAMKEQVDAMVPDETGYCEGNLKLPMFFHQRGELRIAVFAIARELAVSYHREADLDSFINYLAEIAASLDTDGPPPPFVKQSPGLVA